MIVTVTMNPAIDKTVETDRFIYGGLNRIISPVIDAGGKGINVSKTIKALGGKSLATGFLGKEGSDTILKCLQKEGIENDFVFVDGVTRTNLKIMEKDGTLTEINEQGMTVSKEKVKELTEKLESYAGEDVLFILAGSIPKGVDKDVYAHIIEKVKAKGAKVFADADGDLFAETLKAVPDMLKPNHVELAEYFGLQEDVSETQLIEAGRKLLAKGAETVAISRGSKGALFLDANETKVIRCEALQVDVHSTVGAGDAMVAALAFAKDAKMSWEDSITLAMAASNGAVTTTGTKPPDKALIEALQKQVKQIIAE